MLAARDAKPSTVHIDWLHVAGETLNVLAAFWWLWLLVALIGTARVGYRLYQSRRLSRSGIREVDVMDGKMFERYLATLFRRLGYQVEQTRYRGDYGADLVVRRSGMKVAVQAKRWTKNVGVKAVQEAVAAKGYYKADAAMVVTNRGFTEQARVLARANDVELWDRDRLVSEMLSHPAASSAIAATHSASS
jgi:restriction system protein